MGIVASFRIYDPTVPEKKGGISCYFYRKRDVALEVFNPGREEPLLLGPRPDGPEVDIGALFVQTLEYLQNPQNRHMPVEAINMAIERLIPIVN